MPGADRDGVVVRIKADGIAERPLSDEPAELPDETEGVLVPARDGDDLSDAERAFLHVSLRRAGEQFAAGHGSDAEEALARLRGGNVAP